MEMMQLCSPYNEKIYLYCCTQKNCVTCIFKINVKLESMFCCVDLLVIEMC